MSRVGDRVARWSGGGAAARRRSRLALATSLLLSAAACAGEASPEAAAPDGAGVVDGGAGGAADSHDGRAAAKREGPFADQVGAFTPGEGAGFGQDKLPGVVLGGPEGKGPSGGSLDVVSLGCGGSLVLELHDTVLVDGPGPDLLVFENPFPGWTELGEVAVSDDGVTWHSWPCAKDDKAGGFPGCAGVNAVLANSANGVDPTDPKVAGGDAFDLQALGVAQARFVRVTDAGTSDCTPPSAGFDLDAIAVVNGKPAP